MHVLKKIREIILNKKTKKLNIIVKLYNVIVNIKVDSLLYLLRLSRDLI